MCIETTDGSYSCKESYFKSDFDLTKLTEFIMCINDFLNLAKVNVRLL